MRRLLRIVLAMAVAVVVGDNARAAAPSCADLNDDGFVNVADPVYLLRWLFSGGPPLPCAEAASACGDLNGDEAVGMEDAVHLLGWLFLGTLELVCPPSCEKDATQIDGFTFVGCNAQGYADYMHDQTGIIFVYVPSGKFNMGSPEGESRRNDDEGPVHEVTMSAFLIAKYEVTQGQWKQVMGANPSYHQDWRVPAGMNTDHLPVEDVSWNAIQEFEAKTGLGLPTEAQWEYAARAAKETAFSFGSGDSCRGNWSCEACPERDGFMWYCGTTGGASNGRTYDVGIKAANAFGLHDVHGNVAEWCEDVYDRGYYSKPEAAGPDPLSSSSSEYGIYRVYRGGGYSESADLCRSACRRRAYQTARMVDLGFRPAVWPVE